MEKINLEKAREHLAALNTELGVKTFDKDVIERLSSYIDEYIYRQVDNLTMHDKITDCEFSINYSNEVVLDDFYVDSDDIARELSAYEALEYAIDRYEAEEKAKKETTAVQKLNQVVDEVVDEVVKEIEEIDKKANQENLNNTKNEG